MLDYKLHGRIYGNQIRYAVPLDHTQLKLMTTWIIIGNLRTTKIETIEKSSISTNTDSDTCFGRTLILFRYLSETLMIFTYLKVLVSNLCDHLRIYN